MLQKLCLFVREKIQNLPQRKNFILVKRHMKNVGEIKPRQRRKKMRFITLLKDYSTLGVHYRDLQARVHKQETRNLTLHEAQPSAVLNFEFLVRERVLVNPIMHEQ